MESVSKIFIALSYDLCSAKYKQMTFAAVIVNLSTHEAIDYLHIEMGPSDERIWQYRRRETND